MFDVAPTELLLVAVVALVVIGPKDLPRAMRVVGQWVGRARGMARHFRSGIDEMIRQSELEEMEKKWKEENERIMREFPALDEPAALPPPEPASENSLIPPTAAAAAETAAVEEHAVSRDLSEWEAAAISPLPAEPAPEKPAKPAALEPRGGREEQLSLLPPDPPVRPESDPHEARSTDGEKPFRP